MPPRKNFLSSTSSSTGVTLVFIAVTTDASNAIAESINAKIQRYSVRAFVLYLSGCEWHLNTNDPKAKFQQLKQLVRDERVVIWGGPLNYLNFSADT